MFEGEEIRKMRDIPPMAHGDLNHRLVDQMLREVGQGVVDLVQLYPDLETSTSLLRDVIFISTFTVTGTCVHDLTLLVQIGEKLSLEPWGDQF